MKHTRYRLLCVIAITMLATTFVSANVVYTYTGNPFVTFGAPYACTAGVGECALSGTMTLAALLPANLNLPLTGPGYGFTPLSLSFTDGANVLNLSNAPYLNVFEVFVTNGSSVPLNWDVALATGGSIPRLEIATANDIGNSDCCIYDISYQYVSGGPLQYAFNGNGLEIPGDNYLGNPGTWTVSGASVPESSSILLLGTGLMGAIGLVRRKLARK